ARHLACLSVNVKFDFVGLHRQLRSPRALEDATGINAHLTIGIRQTRSVAHQPADFGIPTPRICRGDRAVRSQLNQLDTSGSEEGAAADEERVGALTPKSREGSVVPTAEISVNDLALQPHGASRGFNVSQRGRSNRSIVRIDEHGNASCSRHQLTLTATRWRTNSAASCGSRSI